jgi:hypothetical protein
LVIPRPNIVLVHYARQLDESAVAAAATVSSKLQRILRSWKMLDLNQLAAKRQGSFFPVAVSD